MFILGSGVLARVTFTALAVAETDFFVSDVLLSIPFGSEIADVVINEATLTVTAVPLPGTLLLLVSAIAGLGAVGWRRR